MDHNHEADSIFGPPASEHTASTETNWTENTASTSVFDPGQPSPPTLLEEPGWVFNPANVEGFASIPTLGMDRPSFATLAGVQLSQREAKTGGHGEKNASSLENLNEMLKKIQHEIPSLSPTEKTHLRDMLMETMEKVNAPTTGRRKARLSSREITTAGFSCPICAAKVMNHGVYKRHLNDQHYPRNVYRCPSDGCTTLHNRKDKFQHHFRAKHGRTPFDSGMVSKSLVECPVPSECPVCCVSTKTWDKFYDCLISHSHVIDDGESRNDEHSEAQDPVESAISTTNTQIWDENGLPRSDSLIHFSPNFDQQNYLESLFLKPELGSKRGTIYSHTEGPPAKRSKLDGNNANRGKIIAIRESEDEYNNKTALSISQNLSAESQNSDQEIFSIGSLTQTDTTQPSQDSFNTPDSEIQQTGELDHLLNPTEYYAKLDELEFRTAERLHLTSHSKIRNLTDPEAQTISSNGPSALEPFRETYQYMLDNLSETLRYLNSEGFCGSNFSILIEDQSRPQVANIVHLSLDDFNCGSESTSEHAITLLEKILHSLEDEKKAVQSSRSLIYKFLENLLPLALVSYTGSHVCRFDMNIWNEHTDEIPVGLGFSYRSRELACLKSFIGGPAWVLGKSGDQETQTGLKVSMTVQDLQELWGPVWLVGGTKDEAPIIRTERGFIIPLPRAEQVSSLEGHEEIDCHWTKTIPDFIDQEDRILLTSNSRILIGTDPAKAGGLTVNPSCGSQIDEIQQHIAHQFQFPGTYNDYYTMEGYEVQLSGGHLVPGGIGIKRKRVPGKTHKDRLISTCLNSKTDIWPLMKLRVGLEISACTGNAQRIDLWDALRLSQTKESPKKIGSCNHEIANPNCIRLCWSRLHSSDQTEFAVNAMPTMNNVAYTNNSFSSKGKEAHHETPLTQDEMRKAILISLYALEYTGIDTEGNLQACWPFLSTPTNHRIAQTRFNKWLDILADTRDMSTFAVVSQRCLDFREECTQRPWGICPQNYLDSFQRTCLSLRVVPQPISQREKEGPRRLKFGLSTPPDSYLTELSPGSAFRIGKKQLHVKKAWKGQQNVMVAYTSSRFDFSSRWMGVLDFQEQLNPEIKGMEPVDVVICSKTYGETR